MWVGLVALVTVVGCGERGAETMTEPGSSPEGRSTIAPDPPPSGPAQQASSAPRPDQGVFGSINGADGQPVQGAMVQPSPGPGNSAAEREVFATSAADGSYGIGLTPGVWDLTISADGYQPVVLQVTVPEGGTAEADVRLDRAD